MGNTVGSRFSWSTAEDYYCVGLWLADGYWRTSSVGLTSVDRELIKRFAVFLKRMAPSHPLKERIYRPKHGEKRKRIGIQVYINHRPLTRTLLALKQGSLHVPRRFQSAYLAGRIDGDGSVDRQYRSGIRIAYGSRFDAERDQKIFGDTNVSLYQYRAARTYVLYLRKHYRERIADELARYSMKLAP